MTSLLYRHGSPLKTKASALAAFCEAIYDIVTIIFIVTLTIRILILQLDSEDDLVQRFDMFSKIPFGANVSISEKVMDPSNHIISPNSTLNHKTQALNVFAYSNVTILTTQTGGFFLVFFDLLDLITEVENLTTFGFAVMVLAKPQALSSGSWTLNPQFSRS